MAKANVHGGTSYHRAPLIWAAINEHEAVVTLHFGTARANVFSTIILLTESDVRTYHHVQIHPNRLYTLIEFLISTTSHNMFHQTAPTVTVTHILQGNITPTRIAITTTITSSSRTLPTYSYRLPLVEEAN